MFPIPLIKCAMNNEHHDNLFIKEVFNITGNPKVEIDYELAKLIHDKWKNAAECDTILKQGKHVNFHLLLCFLFHVQLALEV